MIFLQNTIVFLKGIAPILSASIIVLFTLILAAIPQYRYFVAFYRRIVYGEKLEILSFYMSFVERETEGIKKKSENIKIPFTIEGMTIYLNWHVSGTSGIDIYPVKSSIHHQEGVVQHSVHKKTTEYTLVATGYLPWQKVAHRFTLEVEHIVRRQEIDGEIDIAWEWHAVQIPMSMMNIALPASLPQIKADAIDVGSSLEQIIKSFQSIPHDGISAKQIVPEILHEYRLLPIDLLVPSESAKVMEDPISIDFGLKVDIHIQSYISNNET